jgi:hypothetical protein
MLKRESPSTYHPPARSMFRGVLQLRAHSKARCSRWWNSTRISVLRPWLARLYIQPAQSKPVGFSVFTRCDHGPGRSSLLAGSSKFGVFLADGLLACCFAHLASRGSPVLGSAGSASENPMCQVSRSVRRSALAKTATNHRRSPKPGNLGARRPFPKHGTARLFQSRLAGWAPFRIHCGMTV